MTTLGAFRARSFNVFLAITSILLAFVTNSPHDTFRPSDASAVGWLKAQRYHDVLLLCSTRLRGGTSLPKESARQISSEQLPSCSKQKDALSVQSDPALALPIYRTAGASIMRPAASAPPRNMPFNQVNLLCLTECFMAELLLCAFSVQLHQLSCGELWWGMN